MRAKRHTRSIRKIYVGIVKHKNFDDTIFLRRDSSESERRWPGGFSDPWIKVGYVYSVHVWNTTIICQNQMKLQHAITFAWVVLSHLCKSHASLSITTPTMQKLSKAIARLYRVALVMYTVLSVNPAYLAKHCLQPAQNFSEQSSP